MFWATEFQEKMLLRFIDLSVETLGLKLHDSSISLMNITKFAKCSCLWPLSILMCESDRLKQKYSKIGCLLLCQRFSDSCVLRLFLQLTLNLSFL